MHGIHFVTKMFRPATFIMAQKHKLMCKSQRLLAYTGLIHGSARGTYVISPILFRSLQKLIDLVDDSMARIDAEKLVMPSLGDGKLWKQSGRWNEMGSELFRLQDRQKEDICLAPTFEEEVTSYVASSGVTGYKNLPIKLYQITTKYRDEGQPRFGLLRSREFLMKDLYTFDADRQSARETYDGVCEAYEKLLNHLKLPTIKVEAMTGLMGGNFSHEFHIPADIGEDEILLCDRCGHGRNVETISEETDPDATICPTCVDVDVTSTRRIHAIEVGHCFLLGAKYSTCFGGLVTCHDGIKRPMEMGCFGIGVSRLLAAALEVLSEEEELRWPREIAPYRVAVVLQKMGAKDALSDADISALLSSYAQGFSGEVLVDDRPNRTIGRKMVDLRRLGIPHIVVAKQSGITGRYEIIDVNRDKSSVKSQDEIFQDLRCAS